jgi:thiamine-phosphate pyrophosphorylase
MEDYARFVLDDPGVVGQAKTLRHDLAAAIESHDLAAAIRCRDITGDVGRDVPAEREYERQGTGSVAAAAGKRLSEALRVIEEYGKTIDQGFARAVEQLRYRGYELERQLAIRIDAAQRFGRVRLYVLITEELCHGEWLATARAAIDGGADALQLREKNLPDRELADRARQLAELCRQRGSLCLVNDRPDIAVAAGADGVHLGQDDMSVRDARRIVGPGRIVGVSTHDLGQFTAAVGQSPDYIALGPMFATQTKPQDHIAGPGKLGEALRLTSLPVVAIGGIDVDNLNLVLATGCRCACVCRAVISQPDVAAVARRISAQMRA